MNIFINMGNQSFSTEYQLPDDISKLIIVSSAKPMIFSFSLVSKKFWQICYEFKKYKKYLFLQMFTVKYDYIDLFKLAFNPESKWNGYISGLIASKGNHDLLNWIYTNSVNSFNHITATHAAKNGHLNILKWLHERYCPISKNAARYAAAEGHLEVLKWLYDNDNCEWDKSIATYAARGCQLEILKWLYKKNCEIDYHTSSNAARNGNFEILKWLYQNEIKFGMQTQYEAALKGHLNIVKWLHRKKKRSIILKITTAAATQGHLEMLQWARKKGYNWSADTCRAAAQNGHFEILKWAINNGCLWDKWTTCCAARSGYLEILKWARENACPWDSKECVLAAARGGHRAVLEWLLENGCQWDIDVSKIAAERGRVKLLIWIRKNNYQLHPTLIDYPDDNKFQSVNKWIQKYIIRAKPLLRN